MTTNYATTKAPGVYVEQAPSSAVPIAGAGTSTAAFIGALPDNIAISDSSSQTVPPALAQNASNTTNPTQFPVAAAVGQVVTCFTFTDFATAFGAQDPKTGVYNGYARDPITSGNPTYVLAHAVRGFFNNGGTKCYVTRVEPVTSGNPDLTAALALFEPFDDISTIVAPGLFDYANIQAHVTTNTVNRFAILDAPQTVANYTTTLIPGGTSFPTNTSDSCALYFPWIQVFDPGTQSNIFVPPSGHIAGIYAGVDGQRGVFKAPANVPVLGATDLAYAVSPNQQGTLNPGGTNCIRKLNGSILVWGARTLGGSVNGDFTYINVRRTFNYIRQSIYQGTQWAVFEPNNSTLWTKITREVSAFLRTIWAAGGLVGDKPEQAYYVKCDAETNPPSVQQLGMVVTEVGVAITDPAEFVVFRLGQLTQSN